MTKRFLSPHYWLKKIWLFLATVLVLSAIAVSITRAFLPYLDDYRDEIITALDEQFGVKVAIGTLTAKWERLGPSLTLNNLTLLDTEDSSVQFSVAKADVELDLWQTLWHQEARFKRLSLDGARLTVDLLNQAVGEPQDGLDDPTYYSLVKFFLTHLSHVSLINSELIFREPDERWRKLEVARVSWINDPDRHQGQGSLLMVADTEQTAQFILDIQGDVEKLSSLKGQLYVDVAGIDFAPYMNRVVGDFYKVTSGELNAEIWLEFGWRRLDGIWLALGDNHLSWQLPNEEHRLEISSGRAAWLPMVDGGWQFVTEEVQLATDGNAWKNYDVAGRYHTDRLAMSVAALDVSRLLPLLTLSPVLPPELEQPLRGLLPQGVLSSLGLYLDVTQQSLYLDSNLEKLGWQKWKAIPGVKELNGHLRIHPKGGQLSLKGTELPVSVGELFVEPLTIETLAGDIYWLTSHDSVQFFSDKLTIATPDLTVDSAFNLEVAEQTSLALYADTALRDAGKAYRYYPLPVMSSELVSYLTDALQGGVAEQGSLLWHGAFETYPYTDKQGIFQAFVDLKDARFKFDPEWPALDPVDLQLQFINDGLFINASKGQLMGIELTALTADIPVFEEKSTLYIKAAANSDGPSTTELMLASPLQDSLGAVLQDLPIEGAFSANLDLTIPLYEEDPVVAKGKVAFDKNSVTLTAIDLPIKQLTGALTFEDSTIQFRSAKALLNDYPVRFDLDGHEMSDGNYRVDAKVDGHWPSTALKKLWNDPRIDLLKGSSDWQGVVTVRQAGEQMHTKIKVKTGLKGTAINLPAPFAKAAEESWPLTVQLTGNGSKVKVEWDIPEKLRGVVALTDGGQQMTPNKASIALGTATLRDAPEGEIAVTATLPALDLSPWIEQLPILNPPSEAPTYSPANKPVKQLKLRQLKADVDKFTVADLKLEQMDLMLDIEDDGVSGKLKAKQADLEFTYADKALVVDAELLTIAYADSPAISEIPADAGVPPDLPAADGSHSTEIEEPSQASGADDKQIPTAETKPDIKLEPAKLAAESNLERFTDVGSRHVPSLSLRCKLCGYEDYRFGQMTIELHPWEDGSEGMELKQFSAEPKDAKIEITGGWRPDEQGMLTQFRGQVTSKDVDVSAKYIGIPTLVRQASMEGSFDLNWRGYPEQYQHNLLNGKITSSMKNGYIAEAGNAGVGVIGLLSLDSLARRLRLDFRDMFDKGLYFNSFKGNFAVNEGVVATRDTKMMGPSGSMKIFGHTSLVTEQLDYDVVFYPKLTASLPVLTAFAVTPVTGLYVLALSTVIDPVVEVVYRVNLKIDGTLSNPQVKEVARKSKDVKVDGLEKDVEAE